MNSTGDISHPTGNTQGRSGFWMGLAAYSIWGFFPLYFKALAQVPAAEVLAHRIIWSAAFLLIFVAVTRSGARLRSMVLNRRTLATLTLTTLLISTNWFVFIYAVAAGKVLESSLGYYLNPLVSIFLAAVFLREKLTGRQKVAIALAAAGVGVQTVMIGRLPLISITLAFSFGLYGLIRKAACLPAVTGLAIETTLLSPLALGYLLWLFSADRLSFMALGKNIDILLLLAGVITVTPLILFGGALNRLRLSTMGIMQYIVPTAHFAWAVFAFGEPFTTSHLVSFGFIWAGLFLYSSESLGISRLVTQAALKIQ
ncbi:MAG: EamA family transporter RarD [bacterium]|nr:EamA family transporter RarD [bacterium]MDT8365393.1 EamA family transporter RarD [bacterium]